MLKAFFILFIFLCGNNWISAQESEIAKKEKELIQLHRQLIRSRYGDTDSLMYYSDLFTSKLQHLLASNPKTLQYSFKALSDESICSVKTSKDGLFRIYSWDKQTGGTMRFFNVIYQYKTGSAVKIQPIQFEDEGDPGWFCSDLFMLKAKKKKYYLAFTNSIYSTQDIGQGIKAFELTDKGVNDSILLMKTPDGLKNSLDLAYDFFSVLDNSERPVAEINYNPKKKIISICVSGSNEKQEITPENKQYQFNGMYFEEQVIKSKK